MTYEQCLNLGAYGVIFNRLETREADTFSFEGIENQADAIAIRNANHELFDDINGAGKLLNGITYWGSEMTLVAKEYKQAKVLSLIDSKKRIWTQVIIQKRRKSE
jgi:hypothetical protein